MKLKFLFKPTLHLLILQIVVVNIKQNHAIVYPSKSQDPLAVTELKQHFIAPHKATTTTSTHRHGAVVPHKTLVFAALLPSHELDNKNDCILPKVLSVLELAIHHVQRMGFAYNAHIDIILISRDTNCSSVHGPLGFFEIYMQQPEINAVWGLPCEYVLAPISRYAGVWQIPVFTSAGNAADFQNKATSYPTLTRLKGAQANNLGNAVRAIIDSFNWTRTALIYQNEHTKIKGNSVCFFCMFVVHDKLDEYKASSYQQAFDTDQWKKADIERMLINLSKQTRSKYNKFLMKVIKNLFFFF